MKRKICVITGSRSEYGLMSSLMKKINEHDDLNLQIIVTGMHLSKKFGNTFQEIESDGFSIDKKIKMLAKSDSDAGIVESMGKGLIGCSKAINSLKPDLILILGDRFEIFVAATAALISRIPVAHIGGGELTMGAFDESLRHSITKMSHIHFVTTPEHRNRVIQLGENPKNVFMVGGLGVDRINETILLSKSEIELQLGIKFQDRSLLVTYHPVTLELDTAKSQMRELLNSLSKLSDTTIIFTMPNADTGGQDIMKMIRTFLRLNPNSYAFHSLGQDKYFSCLAIVDGVIGNSSSGLSEVPVFKKGTINIGDRQLGRLQSTSVINCNPVKQEIDAAIERLYSDGFQNELRNIINPYEMVGASAKITEIISNVSLDNLIKKTFYDL